MTATDPRLSFWSRARRLSLQDWADLARALRHLAAARLHLARVPGGRILTEGRQLPGGTDAGLAARLAWAIPRAADHVPWRSDCLVQALAAQRWLAGRGLGSELVVGVRTDAPGGFAAHAWLIHAGQTVTGGDISAYRPFTRAGG